jgi:hypothetical protein
LIVCDFGSAEVDAVGIGAGAGAGGGLGKELFGADGVDVEAGEDISLVSVADDIPDDMDIGWPPFCAKTRGIIVKLSTNVESQD